MNGSDNDNMANVVCPDYIHTIEHIKYLLIQKKYLLKRVCDFGHSQALLYWWALILTMTKKPQVILKRCNKV